MVNETGDFSLPKNPFGDTGRPISDAELRETAYELLIGACRSSGSKKPLTFISNSEKSTSSAVVLSHTSSSPSLQRSLTAAAASKVKKALGLKKSSMSKEGNGDRRRRAATAGELIRIQMGVSEQTDTRVRRALLRIAASQLGRRMETIVLPLELLQQVKPSDFSDQQEYESWQKRCLKMIELGLLVHPLMPLNKSDTTTQRLKQIIHGAYEKPLEAGRNSEPMQFLRSAVLALACRSVDGTNSETCHWADGFPLNLRLYQMLLEACFDVNDQTSVIEEIDELLDLVKKTWPILGMTEMLHNLCFSWVLFRRYVETEQLESDLLLAASNLLSEIEKDSVVTMDPEYSRVSYPILSAMLGWAEKKLVNYHESFNRDSSDLMQGTTSIAVVSAKLLVEDISREYKKRREVDVARDRVDSYIRSSVKSAFAQRMEKVNYNRRSLKNQRDPIPLLCVIAHEVTELAANEKETYSPMLKNWHPLAVGVAVAMLHRCYGRQLKHFVSEIGELTPDSVQVLIAADKLEKQLVQIAVEDSAESDDGGKGIIREMTPYEADSVIATLVKSWVKTRVDRMGEWVDRILQQEVWNPRANEEQVAPSAIEVLRTIDEYLEAFFLLPIPIQPELVADLISGLDKSLQQYIITAKSGCGTRDMYIPNLPQLTRCSAGSKFFKKKERAQIAPRRNSQVGSSNGNDPLGFPQFCVRINTIQRIRSGIDHLEKKTVSYMEKSGSAEVDGMGNGSGIKFEFSVAACFEAMKQLCEVTAYKIVFGDLSHALWDSLYVGEVFSSRIEPFIQEVDQYLGIVATSVHDRVRTRVITEVMKASFDGFLFVLLGGGPARAFTLHDSSIMEEDFRLLRDLFWSNGDGLPTDVIHRYSVTVKSVVPLMGMDSESLIEQFKQVSLDTYGATAKSRLPMPPTTFQWGPTDPNTLLRVLCYRNDEVAAKFLKRTFNLPTKL